MEVQRSPGKIGDFHMGIMEVFLEVAAGEKRIQGGKIISTGESGWEMDLREKPALGKNAGAGSAVYTQNI